jgi:hypothetical protein
VVLKLKDYPVASAETDGSFNPPRTGRGSPEPSERWSKIARHEEKKDAMLKASICVPLKGFEATPQRSYLANAYPSEVSRDDLQTLYPLKVSAVVGQELKIMMQACGGDQQVKILDNLPSLS